MIFDEGVTIDYRRLRAKLITCEGKGIAVYDIRINKDRTVAKVVKETYESNYCIGRVAFECSHKYVITNSTEYNDLFVWLIRGMFGIPIRYEGN